MTEQTCPKCGLEEAAGSYCSRCGTKTGYDYWHKRERTAKQIAALERTRVKRAGGRP